MTHLYYGDPTEEFSLKLAETLIDGGADILEIGIPYTDPVCDGEVFQRACQRSLINGTNPLKVFAGIRRLRNAGIRNPIYVTSYYGPIFKIGEEIFVKLTKQAGVKGLIIPDLLLEEQKELKNHCKKHHLSLIQFATVYSSEKRLREIVRASTDFIYCIALPGVTGDKKESTRLPRLLKLLRSLADKRIFVGFGISSKGEAERIIRMGADGIIVGSAIARIYEKDLHNPFQALPEISTFIKSLKGDRI